MKNDLKILSVIICDDIRREINNKELLIGVYGSDILLPALPITLNSLAFRVEFYTTSANLGEIVLELKSPQNDTVFSVAGRIEGIQNNRGVLSAVITGINFRAQGKYSLLFGKKEDLKEIYEITVNIGAVPT